MSAMFGGYGLPLNGLLPAALCGPDAKAYALADENTRPAAAARDDEKLPPAEVTEEDGLIKAIGGRTWCGVEYGHAPGYAHSFFEYVDAIRHGDLEEFKRIEAASGDWWFPTLDRGAGAALHIAVDHGQLEAVRFLLDERGAEVNQQDRELGWTPLHRAARIRAGPYLRVFEELLERGADATILSYEGWEDVRTGRLGMPQSVFDVATDAGLGWKPGRLRRLLRALVDKHAAVPKKRVFRYEGPSIGPAGLRLMQQWAGVDMARFKAPPDNWVPPFGAGFKGSEGAQPVAARAWRAAGRDDESYFDRPMTEAELAEQERATLAAQDAAFKEGEEAEAQRQAESRYF